MPDILNGLIISEVLADNPDINASLDVNNSGNADKQDEFIEFQNATNADIDLTGYQVFSLENGLLHSFTSGTIEAGETFVVVGTFDDTLAANAGLDNFVEANGNNNNASSGGGFLEDGEGQKNDTLYLLAPPDPANPSAPRQYIQLSYGQNLNVPGPNEFPAGFPTNVERLGDGETIGSGAPNTTSFIRNADGEFVEGPPDPGDPGVPCFAAGTMILTDAGEVAIETLRPGARIMTKDDGLVTLRAIRSAPIGRAMFGLNPDLRPIVMPAGVLGTTRPLTLSPAHRVMLDGPQVQLQTGSAEALSPVHHLAGHCGIAVDQRNRAVIYVHLLFDAHVLIRANGCWTESLFMGDVAHGAIAAAQGWLVEDGCDLSTIAHARTVRPILKGFEAQGVAKGALGTGQTSERAA